MFLPESLILPRAFPEAISSRAFAKMSSMLLEKANGRPTVFAGCQSGVMCEPVALFLRMYLGFGGPTRFGFLISTGSSNFGQGAPGANTVFIVDGSCSFVDDIFLDDVEGLFELSNCAHVKLRIMNLHC